jgi:hypothetical protein
MQRLQAFKYELMPDGNQQRDMRRFAGSCRFVFNKALALQKANHEAGNKFIRYVEMANQLPAWKSEFAWLKESPSQALQHALKNLDRAFTNFFEKRAEYPCFKKRGYGDSFRFPQGFKLDQANSRIFLPKLGWVRYRNSREILGTVSNVTVSSRNGKWFISIQTEREVEQPVAQGDAVGIDLGVVRFATLSDGTVIPPLSIFKRYAAELRKAQQEAKAGLGRLELLHVTISGGEVSVGAVEDIEGGLTVDAAQICAGFVRPNDGQAREGLLLTHISNSRRTSSCGMPSPRASDARARSNAVTVSGVRSSSSTGAIARERDSGSTMTSRRLRTTGTFSSGNASSRKCACWRSDWKLVSGIVNSCTISSVVDFVTVEAHKSHRDQKHHSCKVNQR